MARYALVFSKKHLTTILDQGRAHNLRVRGKFTNIVVTPGAAVAMTLANELEAYTSKHAIAPDAAPYDVKFSMPFGDEAIVGIVDDMERAWRVISAYGVVSKGMEMFERDARNLRDLWDIQCRSIQPSPLPAALNSSAKALVGTFARLHR